MSAPCTSRASAIIAAMRSAFCVDRADREVELGQGDA